MPTAKLNGAQLWYDDWGPSGEPIIFLHGFGCGREEMGFEEGGAAWLLSNKVAPSTYRCIFMEARGCGCGESRDAPGPYTIEQQAADVLALADHLRLDTFSFCGHSMGGGVGYYLGVHHAARLRRLVLLAPLPSSGARKLVPEGYPLPRTHVLQEWGYVKHNVTSAFEQEMILDVRPNPKSTEEWMRFRAQRRASLPDQYWKEAFFSLANFYKKKELANIELPVLIIAGFNDDLFNANFKDVKLLKNGIFHVLSAAGHQVCFDDPVGVAQAIHNFFRGAAFSRREYEERIVNKMIKRGHCLPPPPAPPASKL